MDSYETRILRVCFGIIPYKENNLQHSSTLKIAQDYITSLIGVLLTLSSSLCMFWPVNDKVNNNIEMQIYIN